MQKIFKHMIIITGIITYMTCSAGKVIFSNKTDEELTIYPVPKTGLPKVAGTLPPKSLTIAIEIPEDVKTVLAMNSAGITKYKRICERKSLAECIKAVEDYANDKKSDPLQAIRKLDPSKTWTAYNRIPADIGNGYSTLPLNKRLGTSKYDLRPTKVLPNKWPIYFASQIKKY